MRPKNSSFGRTYQSDFQLIKPNDWGERKELLFDIHVDTGVLAGETDCVPIERENEGLQIYLHFNYYKFCT